jgi:hypothetical protein
MTCTQVRARCGTWACIFMFQLGATLAAPLGCATPAGLVRPAADDAPPPGLFKVEDRHCENHFDEPDNCPLIEYVELTRSTLPSLAQHPNVQIFWLRPQPGLPRYTYEVWPLSGKHTTQGDYVLHDEGTVRDWLVLRGGEVREYKLESYRTDARREIRLKSHLLLQRVTRTPEIDQLLHLDPE